MRQLFLKIPCAAVLLCCLLISCGRRSADTSPSAQLPTTLSDTLDHLRIQEAPFFKKSPTALQLDSMGLVDVLTLAPEVAVEIVYATADNFMGEILYEDLREAYLLPEAAHKLAEAQRIMAEKRPGYRLIVYDAARPMSVQKKMWRVAVSQGKQYYVSNPANGGGLHNYGAAVDVSVLDDQGRLLDMGTAYDHLGPASNIDRENELVASGQITGEQLQNRLLLRETMLQAGFRTVKSEWWHFNHCSRPQAIRDYRLIDF